MNRDLDERVKLITVILVFIVGIMSGVLVGSLITEKIYQREATALGFAEYSPEKGEWRWKEK